MSLSRSKYRLVTRSDFDGLVCAVLLKHIGLIEQIKFVHPKDMQDGKVAVTAGDITTNLPYVEGVGLAFDHHFSETLRIPAQRPNHVIDPRAPSAARVVYEYYGGRDRFPHSWGDMLAAVDKADSARFTLEEVRKPEGWVLLNFLMDARTGLGRFRDFSISNYQLMMALIDHCRELDISQILELPDVRERVELYFEQQPMFEEQLRRCTTVHRNLVVIDLREEQVIYAGNRFAVYALYPQCNISMHVLWGLKRQNTVFAVGKSIFNHGSSLNIGELMLQYGGGGHASAGTCQVGNQESEKALAELTGQIVYHDEHNGLSVPRRHASESHAARH